MSMMWMLLFQALPGTIERGVRSTFLFSETINTKSIKIHSLSYYGENAMRLGLLGCRLENIPGKIIKPKQSLQTPFLSLSFSLSLSNNTYAYVCV